MAKMKDDTETTDTPDFLKSDDLEGAVAPIVNKAITNHFKRLEAKLEKLMTDRMAEMARPTSDETTDTGAAKAVDETPALKALKARLDAAERATNTEREARDVERKQRMREEERNALTNALRVAGVTDETRLRAAVALKYTEEQRISRDESGKIVWKEPKDGFDDVQDLEKAVKTWVTTEEGKGFLPPRGSQGAGTTPGKASPGKTSKGKRSFEENARLLQDELGKLIGIGIPITED